MQTHSWRFPLVVCLLLLGGCDPTFAGEASLASSSVGALAEAERRIDPFAAGDYVGHVASLSLARGVAQLSQRGELSSRIEKVVARETTFNDRRGFPAFYVFEFEGGGFAVVSAETEFLPLLAVSDTETIDLTDLAPTLEAWFDQSRSSIEAVRSRAPITDEVRRADRAELRGHANEWAPLLADLGFALVGPDSFICTTCEETPTTPPCTSSSEAKVGPFLKTTWGQGSGFNGSTPSGPTCTHTKTGCSQTAAAQLMRYWQHSTKLKADGTPYNFSVMSNLSGGTETGKLMRAIGDVAGASWGCSVTTTPTQGTVNALSAFGYNAYRYSFPNWNHSYWLGSYLAASWPVIMTGSNGSSAHMWVVDGAKTVTHYPTSCAPSGPTHYLHHNWGWKGSDPYGGAGWYVSLPDYAQNNQYIIATPK